MLGAKHGAGGVTTRSERPIVCECGHKGILHLKENDQPFSGLWEDYRLEGFSGKNITITSYADQPKSILAAMEPKCPKCGQVGKVTYAARS
jgi:hypothetical protein